MNPDEDPDLETLSVELDQGGVVSLSLRSVFLTGLSPLERRLVCRLLATMEKLIRTGSAPAVGPHRFEEAHDDPAPAPNCWTCGKGRADAIHTSSGSDE